MAIDPSIPLAAANLSSGGGNEFEQGIELYGQLLQQRRANQEFQSRNKLTGILQGAYDPTTGRFDQTKINAGIAQDPTITLDALPFVNQVQQNENAYLENQTKQFDLSSKQLNWLKGGLGSMLNNPNLTQQDIIKFASNGVKQGFLTPEQAVTELQSLPTDPGQLQGWVRQLYTQSLEGEAQLNAIRPQTQVLNTGGQQQVINIDPLTGQPKVAGQIQNTLSPEAASQPTQFFNRATNQLETIPRSQFVDMQGGAGMGGQPGGMTGRYPGTPGINPNAGGVPGQVGLPAAPALGAQSAADVTGEGAAKAAQALQANAEGASQRVFFLQDMARNLQSFESGPNADWQAKANALALQLAPETAQKLGIDPQSVASKEEFTKFATNLAIQTAGQLGGGTDNQLAAAVSGNPNASLSKLGNEQIIKTLIGLERATQAKNLAWQESGQPPQNYQKWSAQWNQQVDPRVFVSEELTPEERAKMYKGMSEKDRAKFRDSWKRARQAGIVR